MTLFLIFGIITLNGALNDAVMGYSPSLEAIQLYSVSSVYRNASSLVLDLDKNGYSKTAAERIFPFDYSLLKDSNSFLLTQLLSLSAPQISGVFDYLNTAKVLIGDKNYSRAFSGISVDINSTKGTWGGDSNALSFLILPFCYQYSIFDVNHTGFSGATDSSCPAPFDSSKIQSIDINVNILSSGADYNSVLCDSSPCGGALPGSYYKINIDSSNCTSCHLPQNAGLSSSVRLFELRGVNSPSLKISIQNRDFNFSYSSSQNLSVSAQILFNGKPSGFIVKGVSILAQSPSLGAKKQSN